ncbi:MAG TPA: hypothetical protein DCX07_04020 [Phycisphaerales bacterium]|nr:hypothetical protein [Phycisphaerales bacterium]
MAKKMYYSEEEAASKLGKSVSDLDALVRDQKLRVYRDGERKMFRTADVDALAGAGEAEIELAPVDSSGDTAQLSDADVAAPPSKEDTVITAEGISIFDDEDLEIEAADPMAKTQIAPSLEDQVALEGVGSGSGLLDLTRESDNTSLGEVLDNIDMGGAVGEEIAAEASSSAAAPYAPAAPAAVAAVAEPVFVEAIDPSSGLFGGFEVGTMIVALLFISAMLAYVTGAVPEYLVSLQGNMSILLVVAVVIVGAAGGVGMMMGKAAAARQAALRRMGA